ncbi:phytanoyl-CoA dioxygenase family protein [Streptomyces sp. NPDC056361]|uniref:phytanoyl-CoA dioxygenase family protein n=1 Tax=Streptomyces sp. NPDC056361 TaxID=3345795 RepID=UPI0035E3A1F5
MINPDFAISDEDVESFREHGFLKLKGIFSQELVEHMRSLSGSQVTSPTDNYGAGFSKLKYDIGNDDPTILSLMGDPAFSAAMKQLTGAQLFFTQGLGFELEKSKSTGFPWHVGTQSFGFQRREDLGFTIWTPLTEIRAEEQAGGMKYVSKNVFSGEFVYQHINMLPDFMRNEIAAGKEIGYDDFHTLKNNLLNSPEIKPLLDFFAVEDDFEPGDALIFDKYVLHRSVPLGEGPIPSRLAYALRFSSIDARWDQSRVEALAFPRTTFNYNVGSDFNEVVGKADGDLVYDSPHFDGTREARSLG